jgi:hypothetical protein
MQQCAVEARRVVFRVRAASKGMNTIAGARRGYDTAANEKSERCIYFSTAHFISDQNTKRFALASIQPKFRATNTTERPGLARAAEYLHAEYRYNRLTIQMAPRQTPVPQPVCDHGNRRSER